MKLSVVIAAKNEAEMLPDCLQSVAFCDDIIVVDDNSTDDTAAIAKAHRAKVFQRQLDGFATQKNWGATKAKHDWVLILDADERVSPELAQEIQGLKPPKTVAAYSIPFRNYIGGRWLRWGGLYPDRHIRLYDRRRAHYGTREVHEMLEIDGEVTELRGDITHLTYRDLSEYLAKVRQYATLEAATAAKPRYRHALRVFFDRYVRLQGFRDGWYGLASAGLLAYYQLVMRKAKR